MTEFNPQSDQDATPDDVATLYSWANLHGAKYRDFSAARAQTREKARLRAEQALEEEQKNKQEEAQSKDAAEVEYLAVIQARQQEQARQAELAAETAARQAERASQLAAEEAAHRAAEAAAEQAARESAEQAAELAAQQAAERAHEQRLQEQRLQEQRAQEERAQEERAKEQRAQEQRAQEQRAQEQRLQEQRVHEQRAQEHAAQLAEQQATDRSAEQAALAAAQHLAQQRLAWQQLQSQFQSELRTDRIPAVPPPAQQPPHYSPPAQSFAGYGQPYRPPVTQSGQPQYGPAREHKPQEESAMPRSPWATPDEREPAGRPAWLSIESPEAPGHHIPASSLPQAPSPVPPSSVPLAPEDTLQGSRDRLASRWFALRGVFEGIQPPPEAIPAPVVSRAPAMAVFSLAGGVGKTSLVATLGRALSARGERVLLVDTAAFGLLPFFFGATDQRPGLLRTFNPPGGSSDAPIQMVTIDPEGLGSDTPESLSGEISKFARGAGRVIVDLATASGATTRRIMRMSPLVLVPIVPDMNSVVSVSSIDAFFEHNSNPAGKPSMPYYVLNQFDASLPLHLDVREVLREQLAERLLPFALRRVPAMSEALAEGMTVMDYAPGSPLAEDFTTLAGWVKSLSAPATTSYRGVRWCER
ncbi:MAG: cellulose synthase operon protein YhjQ/BcsQ [Terracidiphilus sp.]